MERKEKSPARTCPGLAWRRERARQGQSSTSRHAASRGFSLRALGQRVSAESASVIDWRVGTESDEKPSAPPLAQRIDLAETLQGALRVEEEEGGAQSCGHTHVYVDSAETRRLGQEKKRQIKRVGKVSPSASHRSD